MRRRVFAVGLALAFGAACHTSSGGGSGSSDDGGAGGCPCSVPLEAGAALIPCRAITCVEGIDYLCEQSGAVSPQGACLPPEDAGFADVCTPKCAAKSCEVGDGCGGICRCPPGVLCVGGTCGNGCTGVPGDYCSTAPVDGSAPTTCCGSGYACQGGDSGTAATCCSITGQGPCGTSTDCCDYPAVHCNPIADDAGNDAGTFLAHVCN